MLAAGADRVYWLKVRPDGAAAGIDQLRSRLSGGELVVCESNSLRTVVVPDLFFMLRSAGVEATKNSAREVLDHVDRCVDFDGCGGFDFDPCKVSVVGGQLTVKRDATAVLLAGGRSTRMGGDKRMLAFGGRSLIERSFEALSVMFDEVLVGSNDVPPGVPAESVVCDEPAGVGPIGGIAGSIAAASHDIAFVVACDIPRFDQGLVSSLFRAVVRNEIAVPVDRTGRYESLFAVYRKSTLPVIRKLIHEGEYRIRRAYDNLPTARVPVPCGAEIRNINTREEYEALLNDGAGSDGSSW